MLQRFGDPPSVLAAAAGAKPDAALAALLPAPALTYLRDPDPGPIEADLAWLAQPGNYCLRLSDADYPPLLREIDQPPPLLFVRGNPALLRQPQLAIVGTRKPTAAGARTAREFARFLAARGAAITSGLALGIDGEAHRGALAAHSPPQASGKTIAVLGCGLDTVYPLRHAELAETIVTQGGALVSELALGSPPAAENFPRRNRIIAGLSLGTLVVEAALRSGSLITARLAAEQGREVFAIPGSIHNPMSKGCHALIREGAKLVETADDILVELGALAAAANELNGSRSESNEERAPVTAADGDDLDPDYRRLLACMDGDGGFGTRSVDDLVEQSGLTVEAVSSMLLILELKGLVKASAGGLFSRLQPRNGA